MGWLNAIGNIALAFVVAFILSFAVSIFMAFTAVLTPEISSEDAAFAVFIWSSFVFMSVFAILVLLTIGRHRLLFEAPDPYNRMSTYAKVTCIVYVIVIAMSITSLMANATGMATT